MSAKFPSRDHAQGRIKKLQRTRRPLALSVLPAIPPRNPVARALARRALSSAAGTHVRSAGAMRRAEKVQLDKLLRRPED